MKKIEKQKEHFGELKELKFEKEAIQIVELEERLETLVIWRRGQGFFPDVPRG